MPAHRGHRQAAVVEKDKDMAGAIRDICYTWRHEGMSRDSPRRGPAVAQIVYWAAAAAWSSRDGGDARFLDYWLEVLEHNLRDYADIGREYMRRELLRRFIGMGLDECRVNYRCFYRGHDWETLLDVWHAQFGGLRDLYLFRKAMRDHMEAGTHMPVIADIVSRVPGSAYYREEAQCREKAGADAPGANIIPFGREAAQA